jgi:hypothetical protein
MIFLICAVVGIVIGMVIEWHRWHDFDGDTVLSGFLGGIIGIGVALLLWVGVMCLPAEKIGVVDTDTTNIHALADNARYSSYVSGSVFLIQIRTDSTLKYSYMYYEDGRGFAFNEVNAKSCYINYTDDTPRLDVYHPYFTNRFIKWLLGCPGVTGYDYVFYLPKDAEVIDSFTIDFE